MLPFKRLHPLIQKAAERYLVTDGWIQDPLEHHIITVHGEKNFMYFMEPRIRSRGFILEISLKSEDEKPKFTIGEVGGAYQESPIDRDKTKRPLERDRVILRGYTDASTGRNIAFGLEVLYHPSQTPKTPPKVEMNERQRRIMYCFGAIKNHSFRREALSRLDVAQHEIDVLITMSCLKMTGSGPIMTMVGEVNRLPPSPDGRLMEDQW